MKSKDVVLFVYDTPGNFEISRENIGEECVTYKKIINFHSAQEFEEKLNSDKILPNDLVLVVVHVFSETLGGVKQFEVSGMDQEYPELHYKYITNKGTINEMCKRAIDDDLPLCKKDVFKYHDIREYISNYHSRIPTKQKLLNGKSDNEDIPIKKGIFLSHSSKDKEIVFQFRDLILINALGCNNNDILFTSDEATAVKEGASIPGNIEDFIKNKSGLFIQFISENYIKSRVCLNEEGAGWVLSKDNYISMLLPNNSSENLSWIKNFEKASKLNDKDAILNVYDNRKQFFVNDNTGILNRKTDQFLEWLNQNYPTTNK